MLPEVEIKKPSDYAHFSGLILYFKSLINKKMGGGWGRGQERMALSLIRNFDGGSIRVP